MEEPNTHSMIETNSLTGRSYAQAKMRQLAVLSDLLLFTYFNIFLPI
jgi:hypothetical protein